MANYTSKNLFDVISLVEPIFKALRFFQYTQPPKQRLYPSVDIKETQPQSPEQTPQLIDQKTKFDVFIYIKHSSNRKQDIDNLELLERNIVTAIRSATLTTGKLILETNDFQRNTISDNPLKVDGTQSSLTLYFQERSAIIGIIGLNQTVDLPGISGLQLIAETGGRGRNDSRRANDSGLTKVNKGEDVDTRFWEYMYTKTNFDIIETLIGNDTEINATLHETGQSDTTLTIKPTFQRFTVRIDGQKTSIIQIEVIDYTDS
jgi:hypothetical protein